MFSFRIVLISICTYECVHIIKAHRNNLFGTAPMFYLCIYLFFTTDSFANRENRSARMGGPRIGNKTILYSAKNLHTTYGSCNQILRSIFLQCFFPFFFFFNSDNSSPYAVL